MEMALEFRSAFYFVPEKYRVSKKLRHFLVENGFEVGVHGLTHDGNLYRSRKIFEERAKKINRYLGNWDAAGFRSPAMHHNLDWIHDLDIAYDASTFDTDPFEPQSDGVGTIFPFVVHRDSSDTSALMPPSLPASQPSSFFVELPYTLPQDFTLFVLMKEKGVDIWKKKLDWIVSHGGMAFVITHPDYMAFGGEGIGLQTYPADYYAKFLRYLSSNYADRFWHALPKEMASFWARNQALSGGESKRAGKNTLNLNGNKNR
jgi:hypothetical protein